jgi:hypothetical protein
MQMKDMSHTGGKSSKQCIGTPDIVVAGDVVPSVSEHLISRGGKVSTQEAPKDKAAAAC